MKPWVWAGTTAVLAVAFSASGLGDPLRSVAAAAWLALVPALVAGQELPPAEALRDQRPAVYLSSALVLVLAGGVTLLLSLELRDGAGIWLELHAPTPFLLAAAGLLTVCGLAVAYLFRGLSAFFGWQETETVRAIMPATPGEKGLFAVLALAAGAGEEIVFRGFLTAFLIPWFGSSLLAALPVSAAFGMLHGYQGPHGMARAGITGLVLALGVAWTGSLWPAILAHTALNLLFGLVLRRSLLGGVLWK